MNLRQRIGELLQYAPEINLKQINHASKKLHNFC